MKESPLEAEVSTKPVEECKIQDEDQTFSSCQFRAKGNPCSVTCKVLGIGWDTESDMFSLNLASPMENKQCLHYNKEKYSHSDEQAVWR